MRAGANVEAAAWQGFDKTRWLARDFDDGGIVGQHGEDRFAVSGRRLDRVKRLGAEPEQRL